MDLICLIGKNRGRSLKKLKLDKFLAEITIFVNLQYVLTDDFVIEKLS